MRLRLTIRPLNPCAEIPLSYNYYLSSAIYRWIEASSPEYSRFLHGQGFQPEGMARRFKHFCFSQLIVPQRTIKGSRLLIRSPLITWYVGMPVEQSLQHLVTGIFARQEFYIEGEENRFAIEQVEVLPEPAWTSPMRFRMLSPLTVSVPEQRNGKLVARYLFADDPELSEALRSNIINKYNSLRRSDWQSDLHFHCTLDQNFISQRGGAAKISKLITIREGHKDETRIRGFLCPVTLEGDVELIRLAYESGLGEKNSMGFGMLEHAPVQDDHKAQT
ncbi:MAG TPA: CRISPR-associated endoribonuclease Cas6 [Bacteroidota bacterium]|nr:CRISPR-associated endoribonuclease Cas6 [Bacteroidota bacterium]